MNKKRWLLTLLAVSAAVLLTACQGTGGVKVSNSEKVWKEAVADTTVRDYVREHFDELNMDELATEAADEGATLSQQFKATVLLCELEYQTYIKDQGGSVLVYDKTKYTSTQDYTAISNGDDVFAAEYTISTPHAERLLAKADTEAEAFWEAASRANNPYNYFMNLFAAAGSVSSETLIKLTVDVPETAAGYKEDAAEAVDRWLAESPTRLLTIGDALIEAGYFKDKDFLHLSRNYINKQSGPIMIQDMEEGFAYLRFMRDQMIPELETQYTSDFSRMVVDSERLGERYYQTGINVAIDDTLDLKEAAAEVETVDLADKTLVGFYHNIQADEFADSPAPLRLMGDLMLTIPDEMVPDSIAEADYYLVLTPNYVPGDYYQMNSSGSKQVQQVFSYTSIDLYEAATGLLIRNLGTVREKPSDSIYFTNEDERSELEYPVMVSADKLLFMYQNVNEPDTYKDLLEAYAGDQSGMAAGETVEIGSWAITFDSFDVVDSITEGMFIYSPTEGSRFLRCSVTITSNNNEKKSLFPMIYYEGKDLTAKIKTADGQSFNPLSGVSSKKYYDSTSFEPGETQTRYVLFEVPDGLMESDQQITLEWAIKPQSASYLIKE